MNNKIIQVFLLTGCKNFFMSLMLSRYEPKTISKIPVMPKTLGNSPTINGDVISKKSGVKASIGIVTENGDNFIAFIYKKAVSELKLPLIKIMI